MTHFVLHTWLGQLIASYVAGYAACWYAGIRRWQKRGRPTDGDFGAFVLAFVWPFALPFYLAERHASARPARESRELRRMRTRVEQEKLSLQHEVEIESLRGQLEAVQAARINGVPYADRQLERGEVLP